MKIMSVGWGLLLSGIVSASAARYEATDSSVRRAEPAGIQIVGATVELPAGRYWRVETQPPAASGLRDVVLLPPEEAVRLMQGRRYRQMEEQRRRQQGKRLLHSVYWKARSYARSHDGVSPPTVAGITNSFVKGENLEKIHYIPSVRLLKHAGTNRWENARRELLAFELRPSVDDGRHWKLWSDGSVRLEPILPELFTVHGVEWVPGGTPVEAQMKAVPEKLTYNLAALHVPKGQARPVDIAIRDERSDEQATIRWDVSHPAAGDESLVKAWGARRAWSWASLDQGDGASLLTYWTHAAARQYGISVPAMNRDDPRRNRGRDTTMFNMLGGRAAIRETLQMQSIEGQSSSNRTATIPVESITSVNVKSHPFQEMLKGRAGGELPLADFVPADRFFAYFAAPEALLQLMDGGASFIFESGSSFTGRALQYQVTQSYLKRLGLEEKWTRQLLQSGAVKELAIALPDLFVVDGTDLTVMCRLRNPVLAATALKLLGVSDLSSVVERPLDGGGATYWTQRGNLLLLSSSKPELDRVLQLMQEPRHSLGRSAEFRYMLTRHPLNAQTRAYFYFSDPFIRRLVGPEVKIGQLRRLTARSELEAVTAGALLYQADGHADSPTVDNLVQRGYAPQPLVATNSQLDASGVAYDAYYGRPARLATLLETRVTHATPAEAAAYKTYVDNYNRYWRRFFDPIAIRFDQSSERDMALSVFILPLVDNSLYRGAREILIPGENPHPLPLPQLSPAPVATLSLNLREETWLQVVNGLDGMFERFLGRSSSVLDHLGPDVHLAMADADPIISMGSGELTGLMGIAGGFDDDMFAIPIVVSMLTRPSVLLVGVDDPQAVLDELRHWPTGKMRRAFGGFGTGALYRIAGQDAWHFTLSIENVLSLRFGIEVKDRYLVINNLPLSHDPEVSAWREADHNAAALVLSPGACIKQLPALFTSASERQRQAAMGGMGGLYPLLRTGASTVTDAQARHRELLGFAPLHPGRGEWTWDGNQLRSTVFGSPGHEQQPAFDPDDSQYGVFRGVERVRLSMQFEDDGLRTTCRWALKPKR